MSELFREKPLQELAPSERYDALVTVIRPRAWWLAGSVSLLFLTLVVWAGQLKVSERETFPGILMRGKLTAVSSRSGGQITSLEVTEGQEVPAGQVLATLETPELNERRELAALKLAQARLALDQGDPSAKEPAALAREELAYWERRLENSRQVLSPRPGRVIEIRKQAGDTLKPGETLLIHLSQEEATATIGYAFADVHQRETLREGMPCRIRIRGGSQTEPQTVPGNILSISPFPASGARLNLLLLNDALVERFSRHGAPFLVQVGFSGQKAAGLQPLAIEDGQLFDLETETGTRSVLGMILPFSSQDGQP